VPAKHNLKAWRQLARHPATGQPAHTVMTAWRLAWQEGLLRMHLRVIEWHRQRAVVTWKAVAVNP